MQSETAAVFTLIHPTEQQMYWNVLIMSDDGDWKLNTELSLDCTILLQAVKYFITVPVLIKDDPVL